MPNEQNLKPFKKGFDVRRNTEGAPRKVVTQLKELGYNAREINDTLLALIALTESEVQYIADNELNNNMLERIAAKSLLNALKKGSLYNLQELITRAIGKPKETQQVQSDSRIEVVFVNGKTIL